MARRLCASSSTASTTSVWAPRLALVALPLGTGAALYVWRNWPDGESVRDGLAGRWADEDMLPRAKFERRYRLVKSLGKGGFGEVWLAVEKVSGGCRTRTNSVGGTHALWEPHALCGCHTRSLAATHAPMATDPWCLLSLVCLLPCVSQARRLP